MNKIKVNERYHKHQSWEGVVNSLIKKYDGWDDVYSVTVTDPKTGILLGALLPKWCLIEIS